MPARVVDVARLRGMLRFLFIIYVSERSPALGFNDLNMCVRFSTTTSTIKYLRKRLQDIWARQRHAPTSNQQLRLILQSVGNFGCRHEASFIVFRITL